MIIGTNNKTIIIQMSTNSNTIKSTIRITTITKIPTGKVMIRTMNINSLTMTTKMATMTAIIMKETITNKIWMIMLMTTTRKSKNMITIQQSTSKTKLYMEGILSKISQLSNNKWKSLTTTTKNKKS
jgi:hypothetical protein